MNTTAALLLVLVPWSVPVVWAAHVDANTYRLPNRTVVPGLLLTLELAIVASIWRSQILTGSLIGAGLMATVFLLAHLLRPHGLGFGDVKYGALIGAGLGAVTPVLVLLAYILAIPAHAMALRWRWWPAQRTPWSPPGVAPFGPALALAASSALLITFVIRLAGS